MAARSDINLSAAEDTFAPWQFSNPWFGTARGRAGVAINNVLIFGTAGLAYGELTGITFRNPSESPTSFGWTAGIGTEVGYAALVGKSGMALSRSRRSPVLSDGSEQWSRRESVAARTELSFLEEYRRYA
jgi:hypothetical protein